MPFVMWAVVVGLAVVVATWLGGISRFAVLAVFHDGLPVVLAAAWIVVGYGLATRQWSLAEVAAPFLVVQLVIVLPRLRSDPAPSWVCAAAPVTVVAANVLVGNHTPDESGAMLVGTGADLIVIAERNDQFIRGFDRADGIRAYPFRVDEPSDDPDYAVAVMSRLALGPGSRSLQAGSLRIVQARVACGNRELTVLGVHLRAVTHARGFRDWRRQADDLATYLADVPTPFIVVGDFNATQFRPGFARLLRVAGLADTHNGVGQGMTRSLKLAARGVFARFPAFARVDHALHSRGVHPLEVVNLPAAGSDHRPFLATFAVEQAADDPAARG